MTVCVEKNTYYLISSLYIILNETRVQTRKPSLGPGYTHTMNTHNPRVTSVFFPLPLDTYCFAGWSSIITKGHPGSLSIHYIHTGWSEFYVLYQNNCNKTMKTVYSSHQFYNTKLRSSCIHSIIIYS